MSIGFSKWDEGTALHTASQGILATFCLLEGVLQLFFLLLLTPFSIYISNGTILITKKIVGG
jgi:hypothetical protein